jgi:ketopantoate reductase
MLQDTEAGRGLEIEALVDAVLELGRLTEIRRRLWLRYTPA